jgi:hypothetical protein
MANGYTIPSTLLLNIGTYANDGTGDDLRTAFIKIKDTLTLINSNLGAMDAASLGTGASVVATPSKVDNVLKFKSITGTSGITVTNTANTVNIAGTFQVISDTSPQLGGNLNIGTHNIVGSGDVQTTVHGIDIRVLNDLVQLLNSTNNYLDLDLGTFTNPNTSQFDLGTF